MISLTVIGFVSMVIELLYGSWAYSCYLTLNECQMIIYMVALLANTAISLLNMSQVTKQNNIKLLFYIANLFFYILALYFMFMRYKAFRLAGGRMGNSKHEKLIDKKDKKKKKD